jgi:hypothetical protein
MAREFFDGGGDDGDFYPNSYDQKIYVDNHEGIRRDQPGFWLVELCQRLKKHGLETVIAEVDHGKWQVPHILDT